jgi:hypothetical protein
MGSASPTRARRRLRVVHHHTAPVRRRIELGVRMRVTTPCDDALDEA